MLNRLKQYDWRNFNYSLILVVVILCLFSAFILKLAGGADKGAGYMRSQLVGLVLGLFVMAVLSVIDYHFICRFVPIYYLVGIILVVLTKVPGIGTDLGTSASRWIKIGSFTFQPSELLKIIYILSLASLFGKIRKQLDQFRSLLWVVLLTLPAFGVIAIQPDLSSGLVILFVMLVITFVAGVTYRVLAPVISIGLPLTLIMYWYVQQPGNIFISAGILKKYQYNRIFAFKHADSLDKDIVDLNRQQNAAVSAIAEGGLYGKFLKDGAKEGCSRAYTSVSIRESDFVWSVIAEEFGFLGCCLILVLFAVVIIKCFMVAKKAQDFLGMLIAVGVSAMFMFQIFSNICVVTFLFPNTGLPLPFLSNGLSSMMSSMIGIGLVINIGIQPAKSKKGGFTMRTAYSDSERDVDIDFSL
jgi:rod shape determining protein RodA